MTDLLPSLRRELPIDLQTVDVRGCKVGLVIIDEVNGFATVGAGPLAPPVPNPQVERMVTKTDGMARHILENDHPVLAFLDTHVPGKPEPPYPPHCESGTGQEELVPTLAWLETAPGVTLLRKDCINGFVGGIDPDNGRNSVCDWIIENRLDTLLVVGICTDICVMDFVLTLLSARNHGLVSPLRDVVVVEDACATYDLPVSVAAGLGLPPTAAHPQAETHHIGLYVMASRGAILAGSVTL